MLDDQDEEDYSGDEMVGDVDDGDVDSEGDGGSEADSQEEEEETGTGNFLHERESSSTLDK